MKKGFNLKSFLSGVIVASIGVSTVFAAGNIKSAEYNLNKVIFNGNELNLQGSNLVSIVNEGETNASNYMPVRTILEQMGYSVEWDGVNNAVIISDLKSNPNDTLTDTLNSLPNNADISKEINKDDYMKLADLALYCANAGYILNFDTHYSSVTYGDSNIDNQLAPQDIIPTTINISKDKIIIIDGYSCLEKSYIQNELLPLLPGIEINF